MRFDEQHVRRLIGRLLDGNVSGSGALRVQLRNAVIEEVDAGGVPAFRIMVAADAPEAPVGARIPVEAEAVLADGGIAHFLLHVSDGRLRELECYREDGEAFVSLPDPKELEVQVNEPQ